MDPLTIPPVFSNRRPSLLQLFRNLFGPRSSAPESLQTRTDTQERGDREEDSSLLPAAADAQTSQSDPKEINVSHPIDELHREARGNPMEEIHGDLKDVSLGGSPSSSGRRSPLVLDHSGMEMGDSSDWAISDLSESGSCVGPSVVVEEKQIGKSGASQEAGGQCMGMGATGGASADRRLLGSRPSVLQLFRNLLGRRQSGLKIPGTRGNEDRGDTSNPEENSSQVCAVANSQSSQPAGKELKASHLTDEPCGDATDNSMELILGEIKASSFQDTPSCSGGRAPPMLDHSGMEMGDSSGFVNTTVSKENEASRDLHSRFHGRGTERVDEASGDTGTWGKAGICQVLHAHNDGITRTAGPLAMTSKEFHPEEEKERLLKEGPNEGYPKTELSPWNKLINMCKQRQKFPVPKFHLQENPVRLGTEEGPMLNGFVSPKPHLISSKSSDTALIYRLPDDGAVETVIGQFGRTQAELLANGLREPEED